MTGKQSTKKSPPLISENMWFCFLGGFAAALLGLKWYGVLFWIPVWVGCELIYRGWREHKMRKHHD